MVVSSWIKVKLKSKSKNPLKTLAGLCPATLLYVQFTYAIQLNCDFSQNYLRSLHSLLHSLEIAICKDRHKS